MRSSVYEPAPIGPHFSPVMRQGLPGGAMSRQTETTRHCHRLNRNTGVNLFADHPPHFRLSSGAPGPDLEHAKGDDR
jgi:hypothetical protein